MLVGAKTHCVGHYAISDDARVLSRMHAYDPLKSDWISDEATCDGPVSSPTTLRATTLSFSTSESETSTSTMASPVLATMFAIGGTVIFVLLFVIWRRRKHHSLKTTHVTWPFHDACAVAGQEINMHYDDIFLQAHHKHGLVKQPMTMPVLDRYSMHSAFFCCMPDASNQTQVWVSHSHWPRKLWKSIPGM